MDRLRRIGSDLACLIDPEAGLPSPEGTELHNRLSGSNARLRAVGYQPLVIEKVPQSLQGRLESRYFTPDVISIGPYHHRANPHLTEMEPVKEAVAHEFCSSAPPAPQRLAAGGQHQPPVPGEPAVARFLRAVQPLVAEAKLCYADNFESVFSDDEFANLMVVDGCFLLAVMAILTGDHPQQHLWWTRGRLLQILNDVLLFENQIPWFVMRALIDLRHVNVDAFVAKMLAYFDVASREPPVDVGVPQSQWQQLRFAHLLDLVHQRYLGSVQPCEEGPRPCAPPLAAPDDRTRSDGEGPPPCLPPPTAEGPPQHDREQFSYARPSAPFTSAMELTEGGVHIHATGTCRVADARVEPGLPIASILKLRIAHLALPQLDLTWLPRCWLMNMVALECVANRQDRCGVSSYFALLGSLVHAERDVEELRARRILFSTMSDRGTVEFFERILDALPRQDLYVNTRKKIVDLRTSRRTRSAIHAFFYRNRRVMLAVAPLLSLLVAIVGIIVTNSIRHK